MKSKCNNEKLGFIDCIFITDHKFKNINDPKEWEEAEKAGEIHKICTHESETIGDNTPKIQAINFTIKAK